MDPLDSNPALVDRSKGDEITSWRERQEEDDQILRMRKQVNDALRGHFTPFSVLPGSLTARLDIVAGLLAKDITDQDLCRRSLPEAHCWKDREEVRRGAAVSVHLPVILGLKDCQPEEQGRRQQLLLTACERRRRDGAALCTALVSRDQPQVDQLISRMDLQTVRNVLPYVTLHFDNEELETPAAPRPQSANRIWSVVLSLLTRNPEWGSRGLADQAVELFVQATQADMTYVQCVVLMTRARRCNLTVMESLVHRIMSPKDCKPSDQFCNIIEEDDEVNKGRKIKNITPLHLMTTALLFGKLTKLAIEPRNKSEKPRNC